MKSTSKAEHHHTNSFDLHDAPHIQKAIPIAAAKKISNMPSKSSLTWNVQVVIEGHSWGPGQHSCILHHLRHAPVWSLQHRHCCQIAIPCLFFWLKLWVVWCTARANPTQATPSKLVEGELSITQACCLVRLHADVSDKRQQLICQVFISLV